MAWVENAEGNMVTDVARGDIKRKQVREDILLRMGFKRIAEYRKEMGYVIVLGESGYFCTPFQSAVAIMDHEYRPHDPWVDHAGNSLRDSGLKPEFFQKLPD